MRISAGKLLAVSAFLLSFGGPEARAGRDGEPPAVRAAPPARTGHQAPAVQIQAIEIQAAQGRGQGAAQGAAQGGGAVDPMVGQSRPPPSTQAPARGPGQGASGQSAQGGQGQGGQGQGAQGQGAQGQGQQAQGAQGQGAQGGQQIPGEIPKPYHGSLTFETGTGSILTLTLPAANVYVADPKVAEVRPASATSLFVFGIGAGHTTIAVVDTYGRLLADYQITVHPSGFGAREAQAAIARLIPGSNIQVKPQGKGLMLTGAVSNPADAAQAVSIARGYSTAEGGAPMPVENQMTVAAPSQVTLMVRIAEMKRSVARNLGIDWSSQGFFGKVAGSGGLLGATLNAAASIRCGGVATSGTGGPCFDAVLNALAKDGLAHIMAEPNLTVMSGQAASFQSGGEFPIYVYGSGTGYSVTYKQYGVLLKFLPIVLSDGRINLHVAPEVSEIDSVNSAGQTPGSSSLTASALKTRRAETTVELGSGESFAIAGMLQSTGSDAGSGLPGLGDTPILGALFKTNSMIREQTELVIVVTPILVRPVKNVAQLQMPAEGYTPAGDVDRLLLMRQMPNRDGSIRSGQAGFMVR